MAACLKPASICEDCAPMARTPAPSISFVRLTALLPEVLVAHMSDRRMAEHMPLLTEPRDPDVATRFVAAKEASWRRDGLGHWAILVDGLYVGWGGFQKEGDEWDFGLVLRPDAFGLGWPIMRAALAFARADTRIPFVTFLLPPSRRKLGALARLGANAVGEVEHDGARFLKFRLDTLPSTTARPLH
jgi:RimJ/RimL family protein N-acetyltransferase